MHDIIYYSNNKHYTYVAYQPPTPSPGSGDGGAPNPPPSPPFPRADYATCQVHPLSTFDPAKNGSYDLNTWWAAPASRCSATAPCTFNPCDCCYSDTPNPLVKFQPPVSNGFDYNGNDLANYPTSDPAHCAAYCETTAGCVGFVVATEVQGCWLKSAFGNPYPNNNRPAYLKLGTTLPPTRK